VFQKANPFYLLIIEKWTHFNILVHRILKKFDMWFEFVCHSKCRRIIVSPKCHLKPCRLLHKCAKNRILRVFIRYITLKVLDLSSDLPLFDRQYRFLLVYVAIASLFCTVSEKLPLLRSYDIRDCMWPWKVLRFNNTVGVTGHVRSPMHV